MAIGETHKASLGPAPGFIERTFDSGEGGCVSGLKRGECSVAEYWSEDVWVLTREWLGFWHVNGWIVGKGMQYGLILTCEWRDCWKRNAVWLGSDVWMAGYWRVNGRVLTCEWQGFDVWVWVLGKGLQCGWILTCEWPGFDVWMAEFWRLNGWVLGKGLQCDWILTCE